MLLLLDYLFVGRRRWSLLAIALALTKMVVLAMARVHSKTSRPC